MNWSQTKTILILALLILNSFLGYQLWEKQTKKLDWVQFNENSLEELLQLKNIRLETELSGQQPEMSQLYAQFIPYTLEELVQARGQSLTFEKHQLFSLLTQPYPLSDQWDKELFKQQFIQEYVFRGDQYSFDQQTENEITYVQTFQSHPIFGGTLILEKSQQQEITAYKQIYYHVINQGTARPVISSLTSLRTLLDNQAIPSYSVIKSVTLGYYGQIYDAENQVLTPVWRIVLDYQEQQHVLFVNAITGAIETVPVREETVGGNGT